MARALDQILSELKSVYDPQRQSVQKQISALDPQQNAEFKGLDAAKQDAFSQITDQANRRGLFYSGIPVGEEQRYTGANYLPAVANLKNRYTQQRFSLQDALNGINKDEYSQAYSIRNDELNREQAAAAARAAAAAATPSFNFGQGGSGGANGQVLGASSAAYKQNAGGGFTFSSPDGQQINAAQYSQITGIPFRDLLAMMAKAGDTGAATALNFVGNDYGYDPRKVTSSGRASAYYGLTGKKANVYSAPAQPTTSGGGWGGLVNTLSHPLGF